MEKKDNRISSIELLRILAMIMIVAHHLSAHSKIVWDSGEVIFNEIWIRFLFTGGKIGVNIFVLISGYFLVRSKSFKFIKLVKLIGTVFFYSIVIYVIMICTFDINLNYKDLIKICMPITYNIWWFASSYVILYLFHPFINKIIDKLDKITYKSLLILMFFCQSVVSTFTGQAWQNNDILWFIFLYMFAGYIYKWRKDNVLDFKKGTKYALLVSLLTFSVTIVLEYISIKYSSLSEDTLYLYNLYYIPSFIVAVLLFLSFKDLELKNNKVINHIAITTFGVYLIHDNYFVRAVIWNKFFHIIINSKVWWFPLYTIGAITLTFIVCSLIDMLRKKLGEVLWNLIREKKRKKIIDAINGFADKLISLFYSILNKTTRLLD